MISFKRRLQLAFSSGPAFLFLRLFALAFAGTYRLRTPQADWFEDAAFNAYLRRFGEQFSLNSDRRWMLYQLLRAVADVEGDTAECGVFRGASSFLICQANAAGSRPRTHHLFDSFEGLSTPVAADGTHWREHDLSIPLQVVKGNLAEFPNIAFYPGWIPSRFGEVADRRFSFVHIDVDLYEPTRDSMQFFYPRLTPGGMIVCDDYGFGSCPGATRAVDEFLSEKPEKMINLSDGGGFLIKGMPVRPPIPLPAG